MPHRPRPPGMTPMVESTGYELGHRPVAPGRDLHRRQIQSLINNIVGVWIRGPERAKSELASFIAAFRWKSEQDRSPGNGWAELASYLEGVSTELEKLDEVRGDDLDPRSLWDKISARIADDPDKESLQPQRARVYLAILAALRRQLSDEEREALQRTLRSGAFPALDPQDAWF